MEIGGGSGEHLPFISYVPSESYVSFDLRSMVTKEHLKNLTGEFQSKLSFVEGNAEALPFRDASFDRVFTTCLLHHVDDVLGVLLEARRVTEIGGNCIHYPNRSGRIESISQASGLLSKVTKVN